MAETSRKTESAPAARPCPICGKAATPAYRPFCSNCCADIDLHRWLTGSYAIPAAPEQEDDEALPDESTGKEGR